ncbi:hypothetical protein H4W30_004728 [Amycolatopsis roodepoortensis]|uniref:Uncharacterized protein n=1 Tax=Amycolatopsis roodepoortensis TaxID=700274 RepID=A0ABR9LAE9_9PSEU|nr:hypothetical protein [Amycolatopsis roodepoortensis]
MPTWSTSTTGRPEAVNRPTSSESPACNQGSPLTRYLSLSLMPTQRSGHQCCVHLVAVRRLRGATGSRRFPLAAGRLRARRTRYGSSDRAARRRAARR